MNDIQTIDLILDEKQIRSRSIFKVKLVIGLPNVSYFSILLNMLIIVLVNSNGNE
jgi:hypothetical protein